MKSAHSIYARPLQEVAAPVDRLLALAAKAREFRDEAFEISRNAIAYGRRRGIALTAGQIDTEQGRLLYLRALQRDIRRCRLAADRAMRGKIRSERTDALIIQIIIDGIHVALCRRQQGFRTRVATRGRVPHKAIIIPGERP